MQSRTLQSTCLFESFPFCRVGVCAPWTSLACLQLAFFFFFFFIPEGKGSMSTTRRINLSPGAEPPKLCPTLGMSTKPSRRAASHWMGLSSADNWLSIRDTDNNVGVSGKVVNHYLSVRRPWLPRACLHSFHSVSLTHGLLRNILCTPFLFLGGVHKTYSTDSFLLPTFLGVIAPIAVSGQLSEWSLFLKVSPRQQLIAAAHTFFFSTKAKPSG